MSIVSGYNVQQIANAFLNLGDRDGVPIDPMKIQKLVYLAHGWHLAFFDTPLVLQSAEAWQYGPVFPLLYREFQSFRANPITARATAVGQLDPRTQTHVASVWNTYKQFTPVQLSMMTHEAGGAWDLTVKEFGNSWRPIIPNELIAQEFKRRHQTR
jgi:uncharacterized phage-associated protein